MLVWRHIYHSRGPQNLSVRRLQLLFRDHIEINTSFHMLVADKPVSSYFDPVHIIATDFHVTSFLVF
jgi:hypothetical protein